MEGDDIDVVEDGMKRSMHVTFELRGFGYGAVLSGQFCRSFAVQVDS